MSNKPFLAENGLIANASASVIEGSNTYFVANASGVSVGNIAIQNNAILVGNSTVNCFVNSTVILLGAVQVNTTVIFVGNSSVNTSISAGNVAINGVQLLPAVSDFGVTIGDGTNILATGITGRSLPPFDFAGVLLGYTIIGQESGNTTIDVWKCTYSQFDNGATHPVAADKISGTNPITLSSAYKNQDTTLTGWTTTFAVGDMYTYNVTGTPTNKQVNVIFKYKKTS